jgi:hypothetical protein
MYRYGVKLTAQQVADALQEEFAKENFPNVGYILGSDWLGRAPNSPADYRQAAYARAAMLFGELPV